MVRLFFLDTLARFQVGVGIPVSAEDIILQNFDNDDRKLPVCVCMLWKSNRKKKKIRKLKKPNTCLSHPNSTRLDITSICVYIDFILILLISLLLCSSNYMHESLFVGMPQ